LDGVAEGRVTGSGRHQISAMPKELAQQRAKSLKRGFFWAAAIGFVVLWQAAAHHVVGVTSRTSTSTTSQQQNGGFVPAPSQGYGYGFGNGGSQQPLTQTTVS
jgi:hypothetical protein